MAERKWTMDFGTNTVRFDGQEVFAEAYDMFKRRQETRDTDIAFAQTSVTDALVRWYSQKQAVSGKNEIGSGVLAVDMSAHEMPNKLTGETVLNDIRLTLIFRPDGMVSALFRSPGLTPKEPEYQKDLASGIVVNRASIDLAKGSNVANVHPTKTAAVICLEDRKNFLTDLLVCGWKVLSSAPSI